MFETKMRPSENAFNCETRLRPSKSGLETKTDLEYYNASTWALQREMK